MPKHLSHAVLAVLVVTAALSAGCSKEITIMQYPVFYTPDLKTIAVLPFRNQSGVQGAGEIISDRLAAALSANGTYKVYNRNDLKSLMDERDLQLAVSENPAAAAGKFKKLGGVDVQAVLMGSVTNYSATTQSQQRQEPQYWYDNKGNRQFQGYRVYTWTRNEGNVAVTATLYKVSGETIHSATPAPAQSFAEGSPAQSDAFACRTDACLKMTGALLGEFAVVRRIIKVDPEKAFRTASELYDNQWTWADKFRAGEESMFVVLTLPAECDRNRFRISIVRKDERRELASQDLVWSKQYGGFGYKFSPKAIAEKGGGPGDYVAKFYSGPEPVMTTSFRIIPWSAASPVARVR